MWARVRRLPRPASRFKVKLYDAGIPTQYRDTEYIAWLDDMRIFFQRIITGVTSLPGENIELSISIAFQKLDAGTLAQCGPGNGNWYDIPSFLGDLRFDTGNALTANYATVRHATMKFNTDYYQVNPTTEYYKSWKRQFFYTAIHECFHAVGIGSLWNGPFRIVGLVPVLNTPILLSTILRANVIGTGNPTNAAYTSAGALNEYRAQMVGQGSVASIPIENYNMTPTTTMIQAGGTALAHWKQPSTAIVDHQGRDLRHEVMTAWSSADDEEWISRFTIAALRDIGWEVSFLPLDLPLPQWKSVDY